MKPRVANAAVEIKWACRLTLESEEMFVRQFISLSKFKSEEQSCFAAKVNVIHIKRLQEGLDTLVKYTEDKDLD